MKRLKKYIKDPAFHREVWTIAFGVITGLIIYSLAKWLFFWGIGR